MDSSLFNLAGKAALVTGGNGGIGLGFAQGAAKHGATVCIWGTNADKNAAALESLKTLGTKAHAIRCDVSDEAAVLKSFAETVAVFGRVDACFANAGIGGGGPFAELQTVQWRRRVPDERRQRVSHRR